MVLLFCSPLYVGIFETKDGFPVGVPRSPPLPASGRVSRCGDSSGAVRLSPCVALEGRVFL